MARSTTDDGAPWALVVGGALALAGAIAARRRPAPGIGAPASGDGASPGADDEPTARFGQAPTDARGRPVFSRPVASPQDPGRGREASAPQEIPTKGWKDVGWRVVQQVREDAVPLLGAGVAFYLMLALVPALLAAISLYGLVTSPAEVQDQLRNLLAPLPGAARELVEQQLTNVVSKSEGGLGVRLVVSLAGALFSASAGMRGLIAALNTAYDETETRSFLKIRGLALLLTFGFILVVGLALAALVALPAIFDAVGLESVGRAVVTVLRWPALGALVVVALSLIYRYAPDRDEPRWRWTSWGAVVATVLWLVGSVGFSLYASNFGSYDETYGTLAGVIVLLLWLWVTALVVLIGAELNAELEHQTARDTTKGPERPMGARNAYVADEVGQIAPKNA